MPGITDPTKPQAFEFIFRGRNSKKDFGLLATSYDFLLPPKRQRKMFIPFRDGTYDYGAENYEDRILRIRCIWVSGIVDEMTRSDLREVSYWLSQKGRLILDVEPDKWYVGEIYDPNELTMHYNNRAAGMTTDGEFELSFLCEPFAYKNADLKVIYGSNSDIGINSITYEGTAQTPCTIVLKNNNDFTVNNVEIAVTRRKF